TTTAEQWAYAARFPMRSAGRSAQPLRISVDAEVEEGEVGIAIAKPSLGEFASTERVGLSGLGRTSIQIQLHDPEPGSWLVVRNVAPGGVRSKVRLHAIESLLSAEVPDGVAAPLESPAIPQPRSNANQPVEVWIDVGAHLGERTLSAAEK